MDAQIASIVQRHADLATEFDARVEELAQEALAKYPEVEWILAGNGVWSARLANKTAIEDVEPPHPLIEFLDALWDTSMECGFGGLAFDIHNNS